MNMKYLITAVIISVAMTVSATQAKTFRYEIQELTSSQSGVDYPDLDLNGATSAVLVIDQMTPFEPAVITSLVINFPHTVKLSARNFNSFDGLFRTSVDDAWVYRQLNIVIHDFDVGNPNNQFVNIEAYVSEGDGFIDNQQPAYLGQPLFNASGRLVDMTPSQVVDARTLTINGGRLKLSLRNELTTAFNSGPEYVIVIDSVWFGRGEESLYIPISAPGDIAKFFKPYKMAIRTIPGPEEDENFIRVLAKDEVGGEFESEEFPLQILLDQAYPGIP